MTPTIQALYGVIMDRKTNASEGSYTAYLFEQGMDKILKKVGEECSEVIIAAKNGNNSDTAYEICDLIYHIVVLMAEAGISLEEIDAELTVRSNKQGNLKESKIVDRNT